MGRAKITSITLRMKNVKIGSKEFYDIVNEELLRGIVTPNLHKVSEALIGNFYYTVGSNYGSFTTAFKLWLHYNHPELERHSDQLILINGYALGTKF